MQEAQDDLEEEQIHRLHIKNRNKVSLQCIWPRNQRIKESTHPHHKDSRTRSWPGVKQTTTWRFHLGKQLKQCGWWLWWRNSWSEIMKIELWEQERRGHTTISSLFNSDSYGLCTSLLSLSLWNNEHPIWPLSSFDENLWESRLAPSTEINRLTFPPSFHTSTCCQPNTLLSKACPVDRAKVEP